MSISETGHSIEYVLPSLSRVNVRLGLRDGGPLLRSLVNWGVRMPGLQREPWDGKDATGAMNLAASTGIEPWGMAFKLPDNAVVVGDSRTPSMIIDNLSWGRVSRIPKRIPPKRMYAHSQQSYAERRDFVVTLRPRHAIDIETRLPATPLAIQGIIPIEVKVTPDVSRRLAQQRFELVFFIDGQFFSETEIGFLPATWNVDADKLSPGEHYLSVNLRGYEGMFGFGSLKISVSAKGSEAEREHTPVAKVTGARVP